MQFQQRGERIGSQPAAAGALGEIIAVSGSTAAVGIFEQEWRFT
jgi:hypothetical protein